MYDHGRANWRYRVWASYDAAQGWIVVTIIGAAIGLNAAFLNIVTEWLSDIKMGYCETAFYLNEKFCCWGEDNGELDGLHRRARGHNTDVDCRLSDVASLDRLWSAQLFYLYNIRCMYSLYGCYDLILTSFYRHFLPLYQQPWSSPSLHTPQDPVFQRSSASLPASS
jgi:H+/Cl- antiporter ClcA